MKKKIVVFIIVSLSCYCADAQSVMGRVEDKNETPMFGVNVYWLSSTTGAVTDENGAFSIQPPAHFPSKLIISFVGYKNDTIEVASVDQKVQVYLENSVNLEEFEVVEREDATKFNTMSSLNVEEISAKELGKAACCNLSESFETNASVDVVLADAISGAKKIQMLGLDGIYTQLMFENIPNVRGLSSTYGLSFIPGTWIESIQITKGTGSVVNGYEPITGQINLEYLKPDEAEKLYVNVYGNTMGRAELNVHAAKKN